MHRAVPAAGHDDLAAPFLGTKGDFLGLPGMVGKSEVGGQTQALQLALQERKDLFPSSPAGGR